MRLRFLAIVAAFVLVGAACGDDGDADQGQSDSSDDAPTEAASDGDDAPADEADEVVDGDVEGDAPTLVQNFFSIDGVQYPITINTCFGAPEVDLEVLATVGSSSDTEAYAYVYSTEAGGELSLSAFRINDEAQGLAWSNESGEGASGLTLDGRRISGEVPVTSPDGSTATAVFDFACPG